PRRFPFRFGDTDRTTACSCGRSEKPLCPVDNLPDSEADLYSSCSHIHVYESSRSLVAVSRSHVFPASISFGLQNFASMPNSNADGMSTQRLWHTNFARGAGVLATRFVWVICRA